LARRTERLRGQSAHVARLDGAIAGTPFFIALVPGYLAYLQQEARMTLRIAALYGRDPADLRTTAEILALRGVHPDAEIAESALTEVLESGAPPQITNRRPMRVWVRSVYLLLVFGGFLGAPDREAEREQPPHSRLRAVIGFILGGAVWLSTWVFP